MIYRLETHGAVGDDIETGRRFHEELREGLGDELFTEIYATMARLKESPFLFQRRYGKLRIVLTKRFRYKIIYRVDDDMMIASLVTASLLYTSITRFASTVGCSVRLEISLLSSLSKRPIISNVN